MASWIMLKKDDVNLMKKPSQIEISSEKMLSPPNGSRTHYLSGASCIFT